MKKPRKLQNNFIKAFEIKEKICTYFDSSGAGTVDGMQDGIKRSLCYECDKFSSRDPRLEKVSQREDDRLMRRKKSCDSSFELCAEELNHRANFQTGFFQKIFIHGYEL